MKKRQRYPDKSTVESGPGPAGATFFPGCLPRLRLHGRICLQFPREAPRGLLHSNYFHLTEHLIYFIFPMKKVVCLNRSLSTSRTSFRAVYWQARSRLARSRAPPPLPLKRERRNSPFMLSGKKKYIYTVPKSGFSFWRVHRFQGLI